MDEDYTEAIKKLEINPRASHARILNALWQKNWVTKSKIISLNNNQSDTPRRIRELRKEFGFDIEQRGTGDSSEYRLNSHSFIGKRRRKYLNPNEARELERIQGLKCNICNETFSDRKGNLQIDHRIPFEKMGPTSVENSQFLCTTCNVMKKRICEFCERENCEGCAYAYPEIAKGRIIINIPDELINRADQAAENMGLSLEEYLLNLLEKNT